MRLKIIYCLLFLVSSVSLAQMSREEKLEQLKSRSDIKVTEVEPNIFKLEYPDGKVLYKNIGNYQPPTTNSQQPMYSPTFDSTIIDLTTIDTTLYYHKYRFWQEVPISNRDFDFIRIGDVNRNGKTELYGMKKLFNSDVEPVTVYELNSQGNFNQVYQYPDSNYFCRNIYDVDKDMLEDVHLTYWSDYSPNQQRFFSKVNDSTLATQLSCTLSYYGFQMDDITLGDFDNDQKTDLIFDRSGWPDVHIFEYNSLTNSFDSVYRFDYSEPAPNDQGGYSISDFDLDGKTDIVFGTGKGKLFVIENEGNNQYTNSWQGNVESYHAYIHTPSNDIDRNGKPEFWVLADAYYNGVGTTRLTIFESNGNNSYYIVGRVDLVGIFSFYAGTIQAVDIDNDGIQEIAICIDDNFLILKFIGSTNHHKYQLYYIKQNDLWTQGEWTTYYGATMYDLEQNKDYEILISMNHILYQQTYRYITKIYKPNSSSNIYDNGLIPITNILYQNFPNPFNPSTNISFEINQFSNTTIKVFNVLGKEIKLLLNENLPSGEYTIQWNGKDDKGKSLPGGVYFIQMIAGKYRQTIKSVLLK